MEVNRDLIVRAAVLLFGRPRAKTCKVQVGRVRNVGSTGWSSRSREGRLGKESFPRSN